VRASLRRRACARGRAVARDLRGHRVDGHAVHERRLRQTRGLEHGGCHVDRVVKLRTDLTLRLDALRPVDDGTVACAAEMRGDLLGPLVGRVHRVRPGHGVVVVRIRRAELVDALDQELRRHQFGRFADRLLVERAEQRPLGRSAVVADDVIDERVVEDVELLQPVEQPADMVVGVLQESGIDLHLAPQNGL